MVRVRRRNVGRHHRAGILWPSHTGAVRGGTVTGLKSNEQRKKQRKKRKHKVHNSRSSI